MTKTLMPNTKQREWEEEFENRFGRGLYTRYVTQTTSDKLFYEEMKDVVKDFISQVEAKAYEKGFQDGHAKERWLKDEVEKDAYLKGQKSVGIPGAYDAIVEKAKQETRKELLERIESMKRRTEDYDDLCFDETLEEVLSILKS